MSEQRKKRLQYETTKADGAYWQWSKGFYKSFRMLGYMPFELSDDSEGVVSSLRSWIWAALLLIVHMALVNMGTFIWSRNPKSWENYVKVLESLIRIMVSFTIPHLLVCWVSMPRVIYYINEWRVFEEQYKEVTEKDLPTFNHFLCRHHPILFPIVGICVVILDQYLAQWHFESLLLLPYFFAVHYSLLFTALWSFHCIFIKEIAKAYRHMLIETLNSSPNPEVVRSYCLLWKRLQHQLSQLTATFSAAVATRIIICFTTFVFDSYTLIQAISANDVYKAVGLVIPWLWSFATLTSMGESTHRASLQVGRNILLEVLMVKRETWSHDVIKEVDLLIDTMSTNSHFPNLAGFIVLNRTLTLQMAKTTVTYLVVLLQFDKRALQAMADITLNKNPISSTS